MLVGKGSKTGRSYSLFTLMGKLYLGRKYGVMHGSNRRQPIRAGAWNVLSHRHDDHLPLHSLKYANFGVARFLWVGTSTTGLVALMAAILRE